MISSNITNWYSRSFLTLCLFKLFHFSLDQILSLPDLTLFHDLLVSLVHMLLLRLHVKLLRNKIDNYLEFLKGVLLFHGILDLGPNLWVFPPFEHKIFSLDQKVLLRAQNRARPCDSDPPNEVSSRESIMLHDPTSNQTARSAETCLTVDSNGARLIFYNFKKLLHNINIRCSSIRKDKIIMFNTLFGKACRVISFIIESDDCFNAHLLENRYVICRGKHTISIFVDCRVIWWAKCYKLFRHDPVQIAVLHTFIMLILVQVELFIVEPSQLHTVL